MQEGEAGGRAGGRAFMAVGGLMGLELEVGEWCMVGKWCMVGMVLSVGGCMA